MVRWHNLINGYELEKTLGDSGEEGSLVFMGLHRVVRMEIVSVGRPEFPKQQKEINLQVRGFFFFFFCMLILKGLVGLHRTIQLQLLQHD